MDLGGDHARQAVELDEALAVHRLVAGALAEGGQVLGIEGLLAEGGNGGGLAAVELDLYLAGDTPAHTAEEGVEGFPQWVEPAAGVD